MTKEFYLSVCPLTLKLVIYAKLKDSLSGKCLITHELRKFVMET